MQATVSKEIYWEMSHRLPFHEGHCRNIHGHSYKLRVDITGEMDSNGFVIDFYDIEEILKTIKTELDHGFICDDGDEVMKNFLKENKFKYLIVPFTTSSENIALFILSRVEQGLIDYNNLISIKVRLHETSDVFAEVGKEL